MRPRNGVEAACPRGGDQALIVNPFVRRAGPEDGVDLVCDVRPLRGRDRIRPRRKIAPRRVVVREQTCARLEVGCQISRYRGCGVTAERYRKRHLVGCHIHRAHATAERGGVDPFPTSVHVGGRFDQRQGHLRRLRRSLRRRDKSRRGRAGGLDGKRLKKDRHQQNRPRRPPRQHSKSGSARRDLVERLVVLDAL